MNKELKNFTDQELLNEITRRTKSKKGLPIKAKCFQCLKEFWIKGNNTTQTHSKLHNLDYGSGNEKNKNVFICSSCLRSMYYNKPVFGETVKDLKKRKVLSGYVNNILG